MSLTREVIRSILRKLGFQVDHSIVNLRQSLHHKNVALFTAVAVGDPDDVFSYKIKLIELGCEEIILPLVLNDDFVNLRTAIDRFFVKAANDPITKFVRKWHKRNKANASCVGYGTIPIYDTYPIHSTAAVNNYNATGGTDRAYPYLNIHRGRLTYSNYVHIFRIGGGVGLILHFFDSSSMTYSSVVNDNKHTIDDALDLASDHCD